MKENIHPKTHPVIFRDTSNDEEFITTSTLTSDETKEVDGVEHYVIDIEITSASHPFFTGEQRFVDTEGRVDKFEAKMKKVEEKQQASKKRDEEEDDDDGDDENEKTKEEKSTEEELEELKEDMKEDSEDN